MVKADIRGADLARHTAQRVQSGRAYLVVGASGLPRIWARTLASVARGFDAGLAGATSPPGPERLQAALASAREALLELCNSLTERMVPDATLAGLLIDRGTIHVLSVGSPRVYLYRRGQAQRLTPREAPDEGILHGAPATCAIDLEPADIVLGGSVSAFTTRAVEQVSKVLDAEPRTPVSVLADLLTEPAAAAGMGAAAVAMRVV